MAQVVWFSASHVGITLYLTLFIIARHRLLYMVQALAYGEIRYSEQAARSKGQSVTELLTVANPCTD